MAAKKTDIEQAVENIIGLAILTVEKEYGIDGLDHVLRSVEVRRMSLIYEASKERTWEPK